MLNSHCFFSYRFFPIVEYSKFLVQRRGGISAAVAKIGHFFEARSIFEVNVGVDVDFVVNRGQIGGCKFFWVYIKEHTIAFQNNLHLSIFQEIWQTYRGWTLSHLSFLIFILFDENLIPLKTNIEINIPMFSISYHLFLWNKRPCTPKRMSEPWELTLKSYW